MLSKKDYVILFGHPKNGKSPDNKRLPEALQAYLTLHGVDKIRADAYIPFLLTLSRALEWPGGFAGFYNQATSPQEQQEALQHSALSQIRELWFSSIVSIFKTVNEPQLIQALVYQTLAVLEAARQTQVLDTTVFTSERLKILYNAHPVLAYILAPMDDPHWTNHPNRAVKEQLDSRFQEMQTIFNNAPQSEEKILEHWKTLTQLKVFLALSVDSSNKTLGETCNPTP